MRLKHITKLGWLFIILTIIISSSACTQSATVMPTEIPTLPNAPTEPVAPLEMSAPTQTPTEASIPWNTYRNELHKFTFEYPAAYDEAPYSDSCGLKESDNEIRLGHQIVLQFLESGGSTLEEYANNLLQSKGWTMETKTNEPVNGKEAVTVQYRFGGTNRFGTFTLVKYGDQILALNLTAGNFCDIPEKQVSEPDAYSHLFVSLRFDQ